MTLALIFPGQGSQHVGMGKALAAAEPAARSALEEADAVLGFSLSRLMADGPEEELTATRNAQPALLAHSVAVLRVLEGRTEPPAFAAGHSLGEFSAHVAAGTFSFADALRAVRLRGELMHDAGSTRPGTMAAILGLEDHEVEDVCREVDRGVCVPANYNAPGQLVISGDVAGVEQGMDMAKSKGAKRVVRLNVSGAFHSPLMRPAADGLRARLATTAFADPRVPVVSNATAASVTTSEVARDLLVEQLTSAVRWTASIATMVEGGVTRFLEVGPGSVLCGLNRRNARGLACSSVGEPSDFSTLEA